MDKKLRKYAHNALVEFLSLGSSDEVKQDVQEKGAPFVMAVVEDAVQFTAEGTDKKFREAVPGLLLELAAAGQVKATMVRAALAKYFTDAETFEENVLDFPNMNEYLGKLLGALCAGGVFPLTTLASLLSKDFKTTGVAGDLIVHTVAGVARAAKGGAAKAKAEVSASGLGNCCTWLGPARGLQAVATLGAVDAVDAFGDLPSLAAITRGVAAKADVDELLRSVNALPDALRQDEDFAAQAFAAILDTVAGGAQRDREYDLDVLRSGTEAFSRVLKCLARNGANNEAALIRRCVCATQALANNRKNRPSA